MTQTIESSTIFNDVKIITPKIFEDWRGKTVETFDIRAFDSNIKFVQQSTSYSVKNTLRGLHGDFETYKLVQVLKGRAYFVVADMRKESETYSLWESFILSDLNMKQILVPPGFVNAHFVLSDDIVFHYNLTTHYDSTKQLTIRYDNKFFRIIWPNNNPILSLRDEKTNFNGLIDTL